ncbi:shikimate dehydrogenase [Candidatus Formimonas warabiya]|uniref:Shikimate dehydrogenase (NADP(+)) n=1 Tax=Formimonas warabiya TaxID=1761012 RepID=A0A3G1KPF8_FORW1|nr:shikimate dehydrogenase [Candidatus Formimonas warabiya]ATW24015.1 shikimate dehydrogenase [Candidatus Formimonas warabiya]
MNAINVNTKLVGLLGNPLGHSFSPAMQNRAFEKLGLDYYYLPIEVAGENLGDVVKGISRMNFAGFNVTIPHKINIIKYLDEIDELAEIIGAVNTVTIKDGRLKGYNTDGSGFVRSLEEETGITVQDQNVFILGSGGASRSIALTVAYKGARTICLCNRTVSKAQELAGEINAKVRECCISVTLDKGEMKELLKDCDIFINTTSVGMHPKDEEIPLDPELINEKTIVCDIIYNPLKTKLLKETGKKGCKTVNGLGMLLFQGAEAFKLWTGKDAPVSDMEVILHVLSR